MSLIPTPNRETVIEKSKEVVKHIREKHLKQILDSDGPVFYISDEYPGIWLEHTYDPLVWADLTGETSYAVAQTRMFMKHQREDGHLPCWARHIMGYGQLQECVAFYQLCWEVYQMTGDREYLAETYESGKKWNEWLCANRMGKSGLIEMFCGYDSGHDNSFRLDGMKYLGRIGDDAANYPEACPVAPIIATDLNSILYGDRMALAAMAKELGLDEESAQWKVKAEELKAKLFEVCYDEEDQFFYDVDKNGQVRKCKSISITSMFCEKVLSQEQADAIFERYFRNEKEFGTAYPYPAVSPSDPLFRKNLSGNSWGYFSQGLTMLRSLRWMKHYGYEKELHENMEKWLAAWTVSPLQFGQELDPFTGEPSDCSEWYSSTMLFYLTAAKELGYIDKEVLCK
ncbi:MAG: hypothetical protein IJ315_00205 [Firmicutes bacterium]|nr:hypothetical protein [Bacillota bacterium]